MGFLDRLLGRDDRQQQPSGGWQGQRQDPQQQDPQPGQWPEHSGGGPAAPPGPQGGEDERAIARYRYLLRTAPPEQLEQIHAEAFAQLTPDQRQQLLQSLSEELPEGERPTSDEPAVMARAATRAEMRQPGTLQRSFAGASGGGGGGQRGPGMGAMIGGSLLGSIAGVVVGSAIAQSLFGGYEGSPEATESGDTGEGLGGDSGDAGGDGGGDAAGEAGGDAAGDAAGDAGGDAGGDFGGGDFGGSHFGGGDVGGGDLGGFGDF